MGFTASSLPNSMAVSDTAWSATECTCYYWNGITDAANHPEMRLTHHSLRQAWIKVILNHTEEPAVINSHPRESKEIL